MNEPQIWHYGLVAQYWAEHETDGGPDEVYFKKMIANSGQPALDLGCGSGRLLLPLLQAGLDVDGTDYSEDMIAVCRKRVENHGYTPQLYTQGMHELDLPRRYRTIFASGVIGLGGEHRLTMQGMQRCYEHLRPGGTFSFNYSARWNDPPAWSARLPENRGLWDWWGSGDRTRMADGTDLVMDTRVLGTDPLENTATRQIRIRQYRNDELIAEEIHIQKLDDYSKNELVLMLERVGFEDIKINGDFKDEEATPDHKDFVFIAKK